MDNKYEYSNHCELFGDFLDKKIYLTTSETKLKF